MKLAMCAILAVVIGIVLIMWGFGSKQPPTAQIEGMKILKGYRVDLEGMNSSETCGKRFLYLVGNHGAGKGTKGVIEFSYEPRKVSDQEICNGQMVAYVQIYTSTGLEIEMNWIITIDSRKSNENGWNNFRRSFAQDVWRHRDDL